ncbi:hypothetical protein C8J56DRAFT_882172 [Mycena floridula]|nr:hypothetical protein C8J56DRAFT_882172 [Mycena floridula]
MSRLPRCCSWLPQSTKMVRYSLTRGSIGVNMSILATIPMCTIPYNGYGCGINGYPTADFKVKWHGCKLTGTAERKLAKASRNTVASLVGIFPCPECKRERLRDPDILGKKLHLKLSTMREQELGRARLKYNLIPYNGSPEKHYPAKEDYEWKVAKSIIL